MHSHCINNLINIKDVIVKKVEQNNDFVKIYLETKPKDQLCPHCRQITRRIHDYRMQVIKDLPFQMKHCYLVLRKRRYVCSCGKRFFESYSFLPRYFHRTSRLTYAIANALRSTESIFDISKRYNVSTSTVARILDTISFSKPQLPPVLSIDEFKGNADGQKYQTILTNPKDRRILDILPNRFESDLIQYFGMFSEREKVKYFVTDMNPHFRNIARACFPKATIIADRYHVIRQAIWAMERVRKNEQKCLSDQFRKYFKRSKYLLNKKREKLNEEEMNRLALMFEIAPRLADAYRIKNEFIEIMRSSPSSAIGKPRLIDWLYSVEVMDLPEFHDCTKACHNWFSEIVHSMDHPWTNGFTEGCNNKTKVLKRVCFGVRNFKRFRNRILHCAN